MSSPLKARPNTARSQKKEMQDYVLTFSSVLTEGLTEMSLKRPLDPHAFLAAFILSKSHYPDAKSTCDALYEYAGVEADDESDGVTDEVVAQTGAHLASISVVEPSTPQPVRIIIAGAPCSGKGSQAEYIKAHYGVFHLSTGDLLRAEVAAKTPLGLKAKDFMDNGKLVPDELIIGIVKNKVTQPDVVRQGWLLDGFPRSAVQAQALKDAGIHADLFLQLDVPDQVLIDRVTGRRTDPSTGRTYHIIYDPPPPEVALRCIQRSDDTEEKIQTRLKAYHDAIAAISSLYADVRVVLNGDRKKNIITDEIQTTIDGVIAAKNKTTK